MLVAPHWLGAPGVGFHYKAEIVRDHRSISGIVGGGEWRIKRPVEADGAQERVLRVGA